MGQQAKARAARKEVRAYVKEQQDQQRDHLPPWTPFQRAAPTMSPEKREALIYDLTSKVPTITREQIEASLAEHELKECWVNSRYTVLVDRDVEVDEDWPEMVWLSIRRNDRQCPREERWRDFQRIKNELVGPQHEGVELYPAESRVADCASQFHVICFKSAEHVFPFGFRDGMRMGPSEGSPAVQRPFETD